MVLVPVPSLKRGVPPIRRVILPTLTTHREMHFLLRLGSLLLLVGLVRAQNALPGDIDFVCDSGAVIVKPALEGQHVCIPPTLWYVFVQISP